MNEQLVQVHIERLPEGCFLGTCDAIPGLVAQGRTVTETLEIARDLAKRLVEARLERGEELPAAPLEEKFDIPLVVGV